MTNLIALFAVLLTLGCGRVSEPLKPLEEGSREQPADTEPTTEDNLIVGSERYSCTMCNIHSDTAGACSKCGMTLEKKDTPAAH